MVLSPAAPKQQGQAGEGSPPPHFSPVRGASVLTTVFADGRGQVWSPRRAKVGDLDGGPLALPARGLISSHGVTFHL